ncbi:MAG: DUF2490 domain-containing protein [Bacteroidales bacterium]|nr:DUF2490 domain-containing protein [Bacteroidales bacterium]
MLRKFVFLLVVTLLHTVRGHSQEQDFQTWAGAELGGELFNKINIEIAPEVRLANNSSFARSVLTDVDLSYKLNDFIRFGGRYRFAMKNSLDGPSYLVNRFGVYSRFDLRFDDLRINYRVIYQQEYEGVGRREGGGIAFLEHRHRIALSYFKKKWNLRPSASYELFLQAKPGFLTDEFTSRLSMGLKYKINKKLDLSLGYKLQNEYFENNPLTSHILTVGFSYGL